MTASILIIDDEVQIRKLLRLTLEMEGYRVFEAMSGVEGIANAATVTPDLILLDLGLPDQSGYDVLKNLRNWFSRPVIVLSVQSAVERIATALDAGANDYLTKPFRTDELLARIRAAIRNLKREKNLPWIDYGDLSIDFVSRSVRKNKTLVDLTPTEYKLLAVFAQNESRVLTHQHLLTKIWGFENQNDLHYLRTSVGDLRKKIEDDPNYPTHILTESGVGYRFIGNDSRNDRVSGSN